MATRKKYHRISVSSGEEDIDRPFALLMDILKRPNLGNYVRHVECCTATCMRMDYKEVESQRDLSNEEMNLVRSAVRKGGFTAQEDRVVNMLTQRMDKTATFAYWHRESLGTFISQALTAILIVVSPNVVSMAMTHPSGMSSNRVIDFPLAEILRQANASPENKPYLRNLRSVYLINKSDDSWADSRFYQAMDFSGCLTLFDNLLSIESVRVDVMEEDKNGTPEFKEKCSNISKISIHHSSVSSLYLAGPIWSCKVLREFQYSIGGRASRDGGSPTFNPKTFIKVLCAHKETLEILDVDVENEIYTFEMVDEEERDIQLNEHGGLNETRISDEITRFYKLIWTYGGSLKEFVALKRLSLGINFLLYFAAGFSGESYKKREKLNLVECLPVGLEYLCVRGYQKGENEEHDEQMDALMLFYKSGSSQLKEIEGINEVIPNAQEVQDPDNNAHLLWSLEEMGYESD
ncbi:hypothetical protein N7517_007691 [Penicillium concentricum]|uniref:Uncharacterized protein n=1 Tax=Penicillium concentricum TaxID=293559 RepID=A0A9W9VDN3_9EURO|nr:uncharacterized protein N7517_007691 [Penicillium concentricum]KAJ5375685.1 hypothetical protein N7517_007691 [Penicillium concentricum]